MKLVAAPYMVSRKPDRQGRKFLEHRQQLMRLATFPPPIPLSPFGLHFTGLPQRQVGQRRLTHRRGQVGICRIGKKGTDGNRIGLDPDELIFNNQVRAFGGEGAVGAQREGVIARPQDMPARLEHLSRPGNTVDVFTLMVTFKQGLTVEQDIPGPANNVNPDGLHLHPACGLNGVEDRLPLLEAIHRDIGAIIGDKTEFDLGGHRPTPETQHPRQDHQA